MVNNNMKKKLVSGAFFLLLQLSCFAQNDTIFTYYKNLNDAEILLKDYKDSDNDLALKLKQLNVINESRKKYRADAVQLDILASRVANKMCKEAAENNFAGHWNLAGEKPYQRYAFAGGKDHVMENAASKWVQNTFGSDNKTIANTMAELHYMFMNEKSPDDGHKKNCINKTHNYVGIGYFIKDKQFAYYEEFIDRYFVFENVPEEVKRSQKFTIKISVQPGMYLFCLLAYYEKIPEPMSVRAVSRKSNYADFTNTEALRIYPWELAKMHNNNTYTIALSFDKPGLYYLHIYQNNTELKTEKAFNTDGKTEGSGLVIKVL